jgi:tRNA (cmo5U34)-methyltransferase
MDIVTNKRKKPVMKRDTIYDTHRQPVPPFEFNDQVAAVFDDMLKRSIPLYEEIVRRQAQLVATFYPEGSRIYDLGCSTGNVGLAICEAMGSTPFHLIAVDNSAPMLAIYDERRRAQPAGDRIHLINGDVTQTTFEDAGIVIINFTLQFLSLADRDRLINRVYRGLRPGGLLLFSEKIVHADDDFCALQQEVYYGFKRENGYSDLAIAQKREALERVLVPETVADHLRRVTGAGFKRLDIWLKWFNFCSWICQK